MKGIPDDYHEYAMRILQLLVVSKRPLRKNELAGALAVDVKPDEAGKRHFRPDNKMPRPAEIIEFFSNPGNTARETFLWLDDVDDTIQLAHFSVKEWFIRGQARGKSAITDTKPTAHSRIAEVHSLVAGICLAYLVILEDHYFPSASPGDQTKDKKELRQTYPFVEYAFEFWTVHAAAAEGGDAMDAVDMTAELLLSDKARRLKTRLFQDPSLETSTESLGDNGQESWNPFYYACYFGLFGAARKLIKHKGEVNTEHFDATGGTLRFSDIHMASRTALSLLRAVCKKGYWKVVEFLLNRGAEVDAKLGKKGKTPLQVATRYERLEIVRIVVHRGARLHSERDGKSLELVSIKGNMDLLQKVISVSSDTLLKGPYGIRALKRAWENKHEDAVFELIKRGAGRIMKYLKRGIKKGAKSFFRKLLKHGKRVGHVSHHSERTLASYSVTKQRIEMVDVLVDENVGARDVYYGDALREAASLNKEMMKHFLEKVDNINAHIKECLYNAAERGIADTIQFILGHNPDINAQGGKYGSALQAAAQRGDAEIVKILLDNGADVNAEGGEYGTALQAAICSRSTKTIDLLLKNGAKVNAQGGIYGSVLQAAAYFGNIELIRDLVKRTEIDVNARGEVYGSALQAAIVGQANFTPRDQATSTRASEVIDILLEEKADFNAEGGVYGSPLQAAARFRMNKIIKLLLECGADIDTQSENHGTALHIAAKFGSLKTVEILINNGADMHARVAPYGGVLQAAAMGRREEIFRFLLGKGAKPLGEVTYFEQLDNVGLRRVDFMAFLTNEYNMQQRARMGPDSTAPPPDDAEEGRGQEHTMGRDG